MNILMLLGATSALPLDALTVPLPNYPNKFTILHTNDVHAHLDEFNRGGTNCSPVDKLNNTCFGGIARMKTVIDEFRKNTTNVVLVDAGDQFQGTLFYTFYKGGPSAELMNLLKYDVMTLGNHEFDNGEEYLMSFINMLEFPVVSSNMDLSHSKMANASVMPYVILENGYITNTTAAITMGTSDIIFSDPVAVVQKYIDELHSKGVRRIIAVSHNGYFEDCYLAEKTSGLSLLHKNHSKAEVIGNYPTPIQNLDNKTTYVVTAHRYGDYIGHVDLEWNGCELISLQGDPVLLDQSILQEASVQSMVSNWSTVFYNYTHQVLAVSTAPYKFCEKGKIECEMGELISQCLLDDAESKSMNVSAAWINTGAIRASFPAGNVTYADVLTTLPFGNSIAFYTATGQDLLDMIEGISHRKNVKTGKQLISIPQWAGLGYKFRSKQDPDLSVTLGGAPLEKDMVYTIMTDDFAAAGGDNVVSPVTFTRGEIVAEVVAGCLRRLGTITPFVDGSVSEV